MSTPAVGPVTIDEVHDAVAAGELSREAAATACLARLRAVQPTLRAMVSIDDRVVGAARQRDADAAMGPLEGVCVGVKDLIDVRGTPTRAGSPTRTDTGPAEADAGVVGLLRAAGALVAGKTVTTQFAAMDPGPTTNPWDATATPGGSSSGSGAVVGAGAVPLAIGTQTAGSVCRPAAYCGVSAIKPTFGQFPTSGVVPLAPSFDTVGLICRTVHGVTTAFTALTGAAPEPSRSWRLAVPDPQAFPDADAEALALLAQVTQHAERLGMTTVAAPAFADFPRLIELHRTVMAREAYLVHAADFRQSPSLFAPHIGWLVQTGEFIHTSEYDDALAEIASLRRAHWSALRGVDAVLTLPVPDAAPALATTGAAHYLTPWSALHGPLVVVPGVLNRRGLPLATMLASPPGTDPTALGIAMLLATAVDTLPRHAPGAIGG